MPASTPPRPVGLPGRTAAQLADLAGAAPTTTNVLISGVTLRSAEVRPGDLFAALPGSTAHGAGYAAQAVAAGAVAVLTDPDGAALLADLTVPLIVVPSPRSVLGALSAEVYGHPSRQLDIYGITGTSGKTTTAYLVEAALAACGLTTGMIGTVETRIGDEVLPSAFTTPEAPDLQALLAVMVQRGVKAVAMEVSSHALALNRVGDTRFAVGAFTNLSQDHLDFHTDMEDYFRAKAMLFDGRAGAGVVQVDDAYGARLAADRPTAHTVSSDPSRTDCCWRLESVTAAGLGTQHLTVVGPQGARLAFDLALPGSFNVANAMVALAMASAGGHDPAQAAAAMATVVVPGRMQPVDLGQDFLAVVDYAHKPAALGAVLGAVRGTVPGRIIVVVGAGGDRDKGKRPLMGEQAATAAELVIVTDDNPRSEDPATIRAEVLRGARGVPGVDVQEIGDRRAAIVAAVAAARPGDAVVVAGKGHELGQYVGGRVLPFSDVDELVTALRARAGTPGSDN